MVIFNVIIVGIETNDKVRSISICMCMCVCIYIYIYIYIIWGLDCSSTNYIAVCLEGLELSRSLWPEGCSTGEVGVLGISSTMFV